MHYIRRLKEIVEATNKKFHGCSVAVMHNGSRRQAICLVNYYLNLGVDHIYLYSESSYEFSHERLTLLRCNADYWRLRSEVGENIEARQVDCYLDAADRANETGSSWLLCHDGDELVQTNLSVRSLFQGLNSSIQAITFPTREMRFNSQDDSHHPFGATLSLSSDFPENTRLSDVFGSYACLLRNGFWGHTSGKTIHRLPLWSPRINVHAPLEPCATKIVSYAQGCLLHFDCASFGLWKKKWLDRINGTVLVAGMSPERQKQAQLIRARFEQGESALEELYRSFFFLSPDQVAFLNSENLLSAVNIGGLLASPIHHDPDRTNVIPTEDSCDKAC